MKCKLRRCLSAYVSSENHGLILEKQFKFGDSINGKTKVDINKEKELMEDNLKQLTTIKATNKEIASFMKDLGIQRFPLLSTFFSLLLPHTIFSLLEDPGRERDGHRSRVIFERHTAAGEFKTRYISNALTTQRVELLKNRPLHMMTVVER
ncbi:putative alcohol-forming fatty acyl-CoA reductase [Helianthus annuus]|nr:putative alcohol-forming fatty acyl-CoA reductase [Helianthus annuus]KAJ0884031.1 putative alcohol-forming fatty acyl-CoA reductase [Helianthus annuus]